jgi:hypothetical protein
VFFSLFSTMGSSCSLGDKSDAQNETLGNPNHFDGMVGPDGTSTPAIVSIIKQQQHHIQQQLQQQQQQHRGGGVMPAPMQGPDTLLTTIDLATHAPKKHATVSNPLVSPTNYQRNASAIVNPLPTFAAQKSALSTVATTRDLHTLASSVAESSVLDSHHADLFDASTLTHAGPLMSGDMLVSAQVQRNPLWATDNAGVSFQGGSSSTHHPGHEQRRRRVLSSGEPDPSLDGFFADRTSPTLSDVREESRLPLFPESARSVTSLKSNFRRSVATSSVWGSVASDAGNGGCVQSLDLATFRTY